jgi:sec-independent protein translocase protein TatA
MIFKKGRRRLSKICPPLRAAGHVPLPGAGKKPYRMLSIPDMALLGAAALMFFGPEQLPKVARKVGLLVRDVQNTSQSFIREMERAGDDHSYGPDISRAHLLEDPIAPAVTPPYEAPVHDAYAAEPYAATAAWEHPYAAPAHDPAPVSPLHDVVAPRPANTTADHDLPP